MRLNIYVPVATFNQRSNDGAQIPHEKTGRNRKAIRVGHVSGRVIMHKQRLAIVIAAALGAVATFLPWVDIAYLGSVSGTWGDGWFTLILYIAVLVIGLLKDKSAPLTGGLMYGAIVPGILASIIGLYDFINITSRFSGRGDNLFTAAVNSSISAGIGLYLVIAAGIAIPVVAFVL